MTTMTMLMMMMIGMMVMMMTMTMIMFFLHGAHVLLERLDVLVQLCAELLGMTWRPNSMTPAPSRPVPSRRAPPPCLVQKQTTPHEEQRVHYHTITLRHYYMLHYYTTTPLPFHATTQLHALRSAACLHRIGWSPSLSHGHHRLLFHSRHRRRPP